ncbi:collagen alpha-1(III) chain-like [Psammomys obesus]|uniref:collagen alpha-1(III) chain-like n=1 Tax=Psammomys obesus TaxID=48139 RepID=UPI00245304A2|nr:collagen alpha-1(III) chain-like [Psammomys obesus]
MGTPASSGTQGALDSDPGNEGLECTPSGKRHRLGRVRERARGSQSVGSFEPAGPAAAPASRGGPCGSGRPRGTPASLCARPAAPDRVVSGSASAGAGTQPGCRGSGEVRSPGEGGMGRRQCPPRLPQPTRSHDPPGPAPRAPEGQSRAALALDVSLRSPVLLRGGGTESPESRADGEGSAAPPTPIPADHPTAEGRGGGEVTSPGLQRSPQSRSSSPHPGVAAAARVAAARPAHAPARAAHTLPPRRSPGLREGPRAGPGEEARGGRQERRGPGPRRGCSGLGDRDSGAGRWPGLGLRAGESLDVAKSPPPRRGGGAGRARSGRCPRARAAPASPRPGRPPGPQPPPAALGWPPAGAARSYLGERPGCAPVPAPREAGERAGSRPAGEPPGECSSSSSQPRSARRERPQEGNRIPPCLAARLPRGTRGRLDPVPTTPLARLRRI